jgi:membrane associated rhomboid family serine protease
VLLSPVLDITRSVGASGAIAGVMGAYLLLFPGTHLTCLWGIGAILRVPVAAARRRSQPKIPLWRWTVDLPAWLLLVWFVVQDTLPSFEVMMSGEEISGTNHLAHLSGYLAALTIFLYVRKDLLMRYMQGRSL